MRRAAGALWLTVWCAVLWAVAAPWRNLGGLESERMRWLEWWALCTGVALGYTMGRGVRERVLSGPGRTYARALRFALYPPGVVATLALVALSVTGERGAVGIVATAFLSYWAGLDVAFGAVPLMEARPYAFTRPLEPDERDEVEDFDESGEWRSWDRL